MKVVDRAQRPATGEHASAQPGWQAWEYCSAKMEFDADLTQYGQEGWEFVAAVQIPHDPGTAMFHFKRRRG